MSVDHHKDSMDNKHAMLGNWHGTWTVRFIRTDSINSFVDKIYYNVIIGACFMLFLSRNVIELTLIIQVAQIFNPTTDVIIHIYKELN